jgi:peptidoglycan/LPS O-acetylase OafA/YrhL
MAPALKLGSILENDAQNLVPAERIKPLDGLRGIAIIMVVLFHHLMFWSGWIGVQIFFVLSGYLITSILMANKELPLGFYLKMFYWRRSLRIFPLYFGYLLIMGLVFAATGHPESFGKHWPYLLTYTLNFRRVLPDFGASNIFYGRFWTLAVEEQFYLIWPLLVYLAPRRFFIVIVLTTIGICPLLRALAPYVLAPFMPDADRIGAAVYYLTPCQVDAFAVGAVVVLFGNRFRARSTQVLVFCSLLLLVCGQMNALACTGRLALNTSFGYEINMIRGGQQIWGYTLIDIWAGAWILAAASRNWISAVLAHPWLAYIGKISYGMYVLHQIIEYAIFKITGPLHSTNKLIGFLCYFTILTVVSGLSYRFYEARFLALKVKFFARSLALPATARL